MKKISYATVILLLLCILVSCPNGDGNGAEEAVLEAQPSPEALAALFNTANGFPAELSNSWKIWNHRNPLFTQAFGADPNVLIYQDRLYVYMSNDTLNYSADGTEFGTPSYQYNIQGIRIVSSADLANWTDHGAVNITGPDSTNPLIPQNQWNSMRLIHNPDIDRSWAPTAAWKTVGGKPQFFLYWGNGGNGIGVVVADSPTGPWRAPRNELLINRSTPNCADVLYLFDPSVFVDDDNEAYLYFGGGFEAGVAVNNTGMARRVKLGADMISLAGAPETWYVPYLFEASDMKKIGGRYYFSYSTHYSTSGNSFGLSSQIIANMVSTTGPMASYPGGFSDPATVLTTASTQLQSTDSNNHHAMFEFKGKTYMVYHTQKVGEAMGTYPDIISRRMRSAFIDNMPINADGTIPQIVMTRKGVEQVEYLDPYLLNEAETIGIQGGIYTRPQAAAGNRMVVTSIDTGNWVAVYNADFGPVGATKFTAKVRAADIAGYTGAIELRVNPTGTGVTEDNGNLTPANTAGISGGEVIGRLQVKAKPGKEGHYADITINLDRKVTGVNNLVFVFYSSRGTNPETVLPDSRHRNCFEFDQWQFMQ